MDIVRVEFRLRVIKLLSEPRLCVLEDVWPQGEVEKETSQPDHSFTQLTN